MLAKFTVQRQQSFLQVGFSLQQKKRSNHRILIYTILKAKRKKKREYNTPGELQQCLAIEFHWITHLSHSWCIFQSIKYHGGEKKKLFTFFFSRSASDFNSNSCAQLCSRLWMNAASKNCGSQLFLFQLNIAQEREIISIRFRKKGGCQQYTVAHLVWVFFLQWT